MRYSLRAHSNLEMEASNLVKLLKEYELSQKSGDGGIKSSQGYLRICYSQKKAHSNLEMEASNLVKVT